MLHMDEGTAIDCAIAAAERGLVVTLQSGFLPPSDPKKTVCPWGFRGSIDCLEFGPVDCSGRRCGVPA
jgi:hypothetical protein